jgi:hypothetical protein
MLQESTDLEFSNPVNAYISNINSSTQTGLDNGTYYYRVKNNYDEWSNIVRVTVKHHSLDKAFLFFTSGFCLFICIVTSLIIGHKNTVSKAF